MAVTPLTDIFLKWDADAKNRDPRRDKTNPYSSMIGSRESAHRHRDQVFFLKNREHDFRNFLPSNLSDSPALLKGLVLCGFAASQNYMIT